MLKKILLALSLTLAFAAPGNAGPGGPGSRPGDGPVAGKFDVATPTTPGALHGKVKSRRGNELFTLRAQLDRDTGKPGGSIRGVAVFETGPRKGEKVRLSGQWSAGPNGVGTFHAKILGKRKGEVLVTMRAAFDDSTPMATGAFRGTWKDAR